MVVGELAEAVDLLVIGAGPGGSDAALRAAELGRSVVIVDAGGVDGVGGICLHEGCIPSKVWIDLADRAHRARTSVGRGLTLDGVGVDGPAARSTVVETVAGLRRDLGTRLESAGVRIEQGIARFTRPDQVAVEGGPTTRHFMFQDVVIATGSRPIPLAGLPWSDSRVVDSAGLLAIEAIPDHLLVVGAGYVGVELGTAMAKLGSKVTLVDIADRVLPLLDRSLSRPVTRSLAALGVEVLTGTRVSALQADGVAVEDGTEARTVAADLVLVAIGRTPNTDDLGLAHHRGVHLDAEGRIEVGPNRLASHHVAAIGDVVAGPALAHKASAEGRVAAEALCGHTVAFDPATIPQVVFSDPEVASAGRTVDDARAAGIEASATTVPMRAVPRAVLTGEAFGAASVVWERTTGVVLGVHLAGPHASEVIAEAVLAIEMAVTLDDLALTVHTHPTVAEVLGEAARRACEERKTEMAPDEPATRRVG